MRIYVISQDDWDDYTDVPRSPVPLPDKSTCKSVLVEVGQFWQYSLVKLYTHNYQKHSLWRHLFHLFMKCARHLIIFELQFHLFILARIWGGLKGQAETEVCQVQGWRPTGPKHAGPQRSKESGGNPSSSRLVKKTDDFETRMTAATPFVLSIFFL